MNHFLVSVIFHKGIRHVYDLGVCDVALPAFSYFTYLLFLLGTLIPIVVCYVSLPKDFDFRKRSLMEKGITYCLVAIAAWFVSQKLHADVDYLIRKRHPIDYVARYVLFFYLASSSAVGLHFLCPRGISHEKRTAT